MEQIVTLFFAIIGIIMIVKFFMIAADVRAIKKKLGIVKNYQFFVEIDRLVYIGEKDEARKMLLSSKFDFEHRLKYDSSSDKNRMAYLIEEIDNKLNSIK